MLSPSSRVLPTKSPIFLFSALVWATCAGPAARRPHRTSPVQKKALTPLEVELLFATSQRVSEVMSYAVLGGGRGLLWHEERPGGVWPLAMGPGAVVREEMGHMRTKTMRGAWLLVAWLALAPGVGRGQNSGQYVPAYAPSDIQVPLPYGSTR